jgi:hypothetical protein
MKHAWNGDLSLMVPLSLSLSPSLVDVGECMRRDCTLISRGPGIEVWIG